MVTLVTFGAVVRMPTYAQLSGIVMDHAPKGLREGVYVYVVQTEGSMPILRQRQRVRVLVPDGTPVDSRIAFVATGIPGKDVVGKYGLPALSGSDKTYSTSAAFWQRGEHRDLSLSDRPGVSLAVMIGSQPLGVYVFSKTRPSNFA